MNEKELREIRRRFRPDRSNIPSIVGCLVNGEGQIISRFTQSILLSGMDEGEELLGVMKKVLSGSLGTNLTDVDFSTKAVLESEQHKLLSSLRDTKLKDDAALGKFYGKVAESIHLESSYVILLANDTYDVFTKENDEESGSSAVFSYIVCAICPLKDTDSGLFFREADSLFHSIASNAVLTRPIAGFMFPAFNDRKADIYHALCYNIDISRAYPELMDAVFGTEAPMPPKEQKAAFTSCISDVLGSECSYETVRSVHTQIAEMIEEHKESKDPDPLTLTRATVTEIIASCGVDEDTVRRLGDRLDSSFGKNAELVPKNIVNTRQMEIKLPDIQIKVKPEKQGMISTQVINGRKYILIDASEGAEVNGIRITVTDE